LWSVYKATNIRSLHLAFHRSPMKFFSQLSQLRDFQVIFRNLIVEVFRAFSRECSRCLYEHSFVIVYSSQHFVYFVINRIIIFKFINARHPN